MNQREALLLKYAADLKEKFNIDPDMELLTKVAIGLGPSIYNPDSSTVSSSDDSELERVKNNFLINKLGLSDSPKLDEAISKLMEQYGKTNRTKYRVVVYYLLTTHFGKASVY